MRPRPRQRRYGPRWQRHRHPTRRPCRRGRGGDAAGRDGAAERLARSHGARARRAGKAREARCAPSGAAQERGRAVNATACAPVPVVFERSGFGNAFDVLFAAHAWARSCGRGSASCPVRRTASGESATASRARARRASRRPPAPTPPTSSPAARRGPVRPAAAARPRAANNGAGRPSPPPLRSHARGRVAGGPRVRRPERDGARGRGRLRPRVRSRRRAPPGPLDFERPPAVVARDRPNVCGGRATSTSRCRRTRTRGTTRTAGRTSRAASTGSATSSSRRTTPRPAMSWRGLWRRVTAPRATCRGRPATRRTPRRARTTTTRSRTGGPWPTPGRSTWWDSGAGGRRRTRASSSAPANPTAASRRSPGAPTSSIRGRPTGACAASVPSSLSYAVSPPPQLQTFFGG